MSARRVSRRKRVERIEISLSVALLAEEICGERGVWRISLDFCLVSILFRKFIICLLFVPYRGEESCFILFCFEYNANISGNFCLILFIRIITCVRSDI